VLSARPTQGCPPGEIGLTDAQRTWAGIALGTQDLVTVESYDAFGQGSQAYLGSLEVEVGFATRKTTETPYDQEELGEAFKKVRLNVLVRFVTEFADRCVEFRESDPRAWAAAFDRREEHRPPDVDTDCDAS